MKRGFAFLAAIGLVACATSTAPPDDGVVFGAGAEAGDEGNPYGGGDEGGSGSDSGDPNADSGTALDASVMDTGTPADSGAADTGPVSTGGVCANTSTQIFEYGLLSLAGGATDCSSGPAACATGECCFGSDLCVPE